MTDVSCNTENTASRTWIEATDVAYADPPPKGADMIELLREWWRDRFRPKRRKTFRQRGPMPFRGHHRAGRPEVSQGIGSETRPVPITPLHRPLADPVAYRKRLLHPDKP